MGNLHVIAVLAFFDIHTINDNGVFVLCHCCPTQYASSFARKGVRTLT